MRIKLPTLLVVTDDPVVRIWVKKHLDDSFFIINASTEQAALSAAQNSILDFVILDSELEDRESLDVCRELRKILRTLTPILFITGRLKKSYLQAASEAGVNGFLGNHLDERELREQIAVIQKGHLVREKTQELSGTISHFPSHAQIESLKEREIYQAQALKLLKAAAQKNEPVTGLMIQIDRYENLESRIGDRILTEILYPIESIIQRVLTSNDLFYPRSDGNFIVLLQNTTTKNGRMLAEELKKTILSAALPTSTEQPKLNVSIAVLNLEDSEINFSQIIESSSKTLKTAQDLIISIERSPK